MIGRQLLSRCNAKLLDGEHSPAVSSERTSLHENPRPGDRFRSNCASVCQRPLKRKAGFAAGLY